MQEQLSYIPLDIAALPLLILAILAVHEVCLYMYPSIFSITAVYIGYTSPIVPVAIQRL